MSTAILPLEAWEEGVLQPRFAANDNSLRLEALSREIISLAVTAQPGSPTDGDTYIIAATHTGAQWAGFSPKDIAIYRGGTWTAWAPVEGLIVNVAGTQYKYDGGAWSAVGGGGSGDVVGPGTVVDDRIVTFDGTTGELIQDGGKTIAELRAPAIQSVGSSATVTPTFADDIVLITAQAAGLTLANPTGTAIDGLGMVIRIKDNGTARSITYGSQYRAIGVTLPTTTVLSKTLYLALVFNNTDTKWDVLAVGQEA